MTDFTLPPFVIPYGGWWIDVDLDGDLQAWARRSAEEVLTRWGVRSGRRARKLADLLEAAGGIARDKQQGAISALLLYPALGEGIRAGTLVFPIAADTAAARGQPAGTAIVTRVPSPVLSRARPGLAGRPMQS